MTENYFYVYSVNFVRTSTTGNVGVRLTVGKQQVVEIVSIFMENTGANDGKYIDMRDVSGTDMIIFNGTQGTLVLPCEDHLGRFLNYQGDMILFQGESIYLQGSMLTTSEPLRITIRAKTNVYALPTIDYLSGSTITKLDANKIIGVV